MTLLTGAVCSFVQSGSSCQAPAGSTAHDKVAEKSPVSERWSGAIVSCNEIARGGQGSVYKVVTDDGRQFAAKTFFRHSDLEWERTHFERMGSHPNLVTFLGTKELDLQGRGKVGCLAFEFIEGMSLSKLLEKAADFLKYFPKDARGAASLGDIMKNIKPQDPVGIPEVVAILGHQLFDVLSHMQSHGVSHQDVKPENIMVDRGGCLKLVDLGCADEAHSPVKTMVGTPGYISPELILRRDGENIDSKKVDVYSAANTLLLALTGYRIGSDFESLVVNGSPPVRGEHFECDYFWAIKRNLSPSSMAMADRKELHLGVLGSFFRTTPLADGLMSLFSQSLHSNVAERPQVAEVKERLALLIDNYVPDQSRREAAEFIQKAMSIPASRPAGSGGDSSYRT